MTKKIFLNILTILISIFVSLLICEFALRLKHKLIFDYDLEQWKYSKKLKIKDENKKISKRWNACTEGRTLKVLWAVPLLAKVREIYEDTWDDSKWIRIDWPELVERKGPEAALEIAQNRSFAIAGGQKFLR